jgi:dTDP-4-amino-4,6-dideoxygalactose transaminase
MLNRLIPLVLRLRTRYPRLYSRIVALAKRMLGARLGVYPRPLAGEVAAAATVLRSSRWNMTAGSDLAHEHLEAAFAAYVGVPHAVAVNTGGMALQMSMRALGLKPGDEVIHQVDTCSATALAVMAAGCTPIFADISERTLMLDAAKVEQGIGQRTKALLATHMWGNPEDIPALAEVAQRRGLHLIEDACLSLGTTLGAPPGDRMAGSCGRVGVFSFGCIKPIQGGEGGMIVTHDEGLARELRSMRHWGDRTLEYGVRDTLQPAWNGRMSEIVAAVVAEQLKGYPRHLEALRAAVATFQGFVARIDGLDLVLGNAGNTGECAFTQVVLRIDQKQLGCTKLAYKDALYARGVPVWHANFEPINSLTLFRGSEWEQWLQRADLERTRANYASTFSVAEELMHSRGLGLGKMNFLSKQNLQHLMKQIEALARRPPVP